MDTTTLLDQAYRLERAGAWDEAREAYEQALELDPADPEIHLSLGVVCEELGRPAQAEAHYRAAIDASLEAAGGPLAAEADAHYNLALLYTGRDRLDEARIELEAFLALATKPEDVAEAKARLDEIGAPAYEKCHRCGCVSTLTDLFKKMAGTRTFDGARAKLCPRCRARALSRRNTAIVAVSGVIVLAMALLMAPVLPWAFYFLVTFLLALVLNVLLVIPHEFCHAAATWLLGGRVFAIHLGLGRVLWQTRLGSPGRRALSLSLHPYPLGGLCVIGFGRRPHLRARIFLSLAAGPLFNLLLLLLLLPWADWSRLDWTIGLVEALVLANALQLVTNLLPRTFDRGDLQVGSDGLQLLRVLVGKVDLDDFLVGRYTGEATYALHWEEPDRALAACEAGLAEHPTSTLLNNFKAVALFRLDRYAEAHRLYRDLLARFQESVEPEPGIPEPVRPAMEALLHNGVACASLFDAPDAEALARARDHARTAYRRIPWIPAVQTTWGAVLVETGQIREGLRHLSAAREEEETDRGRAAALAHAARGHHRLGEQEQAALRLQEAERLAPDLYIVKAIRDSCVL